MRLSQLNHTLIVDLFLYKLNQTILRLHFIVYHKVFCLIDFVSYSKISDDEGLSLIGQKRTGNTARMNIDRLLVRGLCMTMT